MQKTSANWNIADPITAARLNDFNVDLATLFKELSNENCSFTYDIQGQLTQIVDTENSVTVNIDWTDFNATSPDSPKLYFQKVGDPKKWTLTYNAAWYPESLIYA